MFTPSEVLTRNITIQENRAKIGTIRLLVLAVMAGMFIAGGAAASSVAMHAISNVGVARTVGGCIFPVGLMLIVFIGGELFTGDCLMIVGVVDKKCKVFDMIRVLVLVWLGNLVGSVIIAGLVYCSGQFNYSGGLLGAFTIKVALGKSTMTFTQGVTSGILCNIFVCLAVLMAQTAKEPSGKIWGIFFPILAFVVSGYEHCVANMYYIPAGIFAKMNPAFVEKAISEYGYSATQLEALNWKSFFINSSIPVTIGNMIGGMIFVGLFIYIVEYLKKQ